VTAGLTIVLLVVGLPLLAWWLGSRRFWDRLRGRTPENDPWGDWVRRHGLTTGQAVQVSRGVPRGEELDDPRLRAAAVDWAQVLLRPARPSTPIARRLLVGALITYAVLLGSFLTYRAVTGHPEDVNWVAVVAWSAFGIWALRRRRNIRRSLDLNSGAPTGAQEQR
jgi:hypothetical protein